MPPPQVMSKSFLFYFKYTPLLTQEPHLKPETMEARREEEHSMFETSHMLGAYLASTPLLTQSWELCQHANTSASSSFAAEMIGDVVYVAFSGTHGAPGPDTGFFRSVPIGSACGQELFRPLAREGEDEGPVLVHAHSLQLFLELCSKPEFKILTSEIRNKAVVLTGHSIGGSLASLAALYFLCSSSSNSPSPASLLCITFGSPLLGNEALSRAILRETWGGNFCHVVAQHDIMPRLLFCPQNSIAPQLIAHLLQTWHFSMQCPSSAKPTSRLPNEVELHQFVSRHVHEAATEQKHSALAHERSPFRPFGCYALCSTDGVVCIDNLVSIVQMLHWTFVTGSARSSIEEEHMLYGDLVARISQNLLAKRRINVREIASTNFAAGVSLALEASGIGNQETVAMEAGECLQTSKKICQSPHLNIANLIIRLAKVTPCRAQIEWYKALCDDDTGYYDAFRQRKASKRDSKVNINRIKLGQFWDEVVEMLENNQLPQDFPKRAKWVNAANFYKLLVEPLDIAEYYRTKTQKSRGHYMSHGRPRRYEVFDRWWRELHKSDTGRGQTRSRFAGQTQDSCFWAKVEEASEWIEAAKTENDQAKLVRIWENLNEFECETRQLIELKEVSKDVVAPRSSYSLWTKEWKDLKMKLGLQVPLRNSVVNQGTLAMS